MLIAKITKEQFDKLGPDLQAEYKADGDSYGLQVEGMKTTADIEAVQESLRKEREDHDETKGILKTAKTEATTLADKVKVYESDDKKKLDSEQLVEFARLQRENETLTDENGTLKGNFEGLQGEVTTGKIKAHLRDKAKGIIRDDAIENEVDQIAKNFTLNGENILTNSEQGDKSGLQAEAYLTSYVEGRSYLAPTSSGGGAGGGKGPGGGAQEQSQDDTILSEMNEAWGVEAK